MRCADCGGYTCTSYTKYGGAYLCDQCREKRYQSEIEKREVSLEKASDLSSWSKRDMSELFWMHLGRYVKEPNEHSLTMMNLAFRWACHDDHGLSNSFSHALKWANIDLYEEQQKFIANKVI